MSTLPLGVPGPSVAMGQQLIVRFQIADALSLLDSLPGSSLAPKPNLISLQALCLLVCVPTRHDPWDRIKLQPPCGLVVLQGNTC